MSDTNTSETAGPATPGDDDTADTPGDTAGRPNRAARRAAAKNKTTGRAGFVNPAADAAHRRGAPLGAPSQRPNNAAGRAGAQRNQSKRGGS